MTVVAGPPSDDHPATPSGLGPHGFDDVAPGNQRIRRIRLWWLASAGTGLQGSRSCRSMQRAHPSRWRNRAKPGGGERASADAGGIGGQGIRNQDLDQARDCIRTATVRRRTAAGVCLMPSKRIPLRRNVRLRITPEAIRLFKLVENCIETGDHEFWEDEGGRRRQYLDADRDLASIFGLHLGEISPCDLQLRLDPRMPEYMRYLCSAETWPVALEVRRALLQALAEAHGREARNGKSALRKPNRELGP
jgi:hypothetical protein